MPAGRAGRPAWRDGGGETNPSFNLLEKGPVQPPRRQRTHLPERQNETDHVLKVLGSSTLVLIKRTPGLIKECASWKMKPRWSEGEAGVETLAPSGSDVDEIC